MSKGSYAQTGLKALAKPLQIYIEAWSGRNKVLGHSRNSKQFSGQMPAPYALAAIRGEAILRERFFNGFLPLPNITLDEAQQIVLWQKMVEDGGYLTQWVQRLGLARALSQEALLPDNINQESRQLYAILLFALQQAGETELLNKAVDRFFMHHFLADFAENDGKTILKPLIATPLAREQKRQELVRTLQKHFAQKVEVRESFKMADDGVHFGLLIKLKNQNRWQNWVEVVRPQLKSARKAAYEEALLVLAKSD